MSQGRNAAIQSCANRPDTCVCGTLREMTEPTASDAPGRLPAEGRPVLSAELLSIGSELTAGETRDTNAGELARHLTTSGVRIARLQGLPDDLEVVTDAIRAALTRVDLVVSTGGVGPTPDDLTREAIAAVCGEAPAVDHGLETWLRDLWSRRGMAFPPSNLKQAWLIPSATALANRNGTAPGWWVDRPDGRIIVALPGPPREMRPMWADEVLPRLRARGLGGGSVTSTLRLTGIGESHVAHMLGEELLRARNPVVATYARAEAVDVRISAVPEPGDPDRPGRSAEEIVREMERRVRMLLGDHVWATGETTWSEAIGEALAGTGWTLASTERRTRGAFNALLGDVPWLVRAESLADDPGDDLEAAAEQVRMAAGADVGLAVRVRPHGDDSAVEIAVATPNSTGGEHRVAFLGGSHGRTRAALLAAAALLARLRAAAPPGNDAGETSDALATHQ
jgi:nicotinamide-nucleotide amidase